MKITIDAGLTEKTYVVEALHLHSCKHQVKGSTVHVTSGPLAGAQVHLDTGVIKGDSDRGHTAEALAVIRQRYAEAVYRLRFTAEGHQVHEAAWTSAGDLSFTWTMR